MKNENILDAIGMINEDAVREAKMYRRPKSRSWVKRSAIAVCLCLVMTASIIYFMSPLKTNVIPADRFSLATSVNSLKAESDVIIIAHADHPGENTLIHVETGDIVSGYTNTTLTVDAVFKGDIQNSSSIVVTEECYTTAFGTVFWTQQGYMPIKAGTKYILFLKAYPDDGDFAGKYYPIDLEYGKYIVPAELDVDGIEALSNSRDKLEVGAVTDLNTYFEWYRAIIQEYLSTGVISISNG